MLRWILARPGWFERIPPEDLRALSPLIYYDTNVDGTLELDLTKRLLLAAAWCRKDIPDQRSISQDLHGTWRQDLSTLAYEA